MTAINADEAADVVAAWRVLQKHGMVIDFRSEAFVCSAECRRAAYDPLQYGRNLALHNLCSLMKDWNHALRTTLDPDSSRDGIQIRLQLSALDQTGLKLARLTARQRTVFPTYGAYIQND